MYKAGPSGLFTSFFQVLDNDLLIAKPVVLGATAGTARHALVVDGEMRSLFAFLRTMTTPTSVFASTEDWQDKALGKRIDRAARERRQRAGHRPRLRPHAPRRGRDVAGHAQVAQHDGTTGPGRPGRVVVCGQARLRSRQPTSR
ncbi:NAD(P)H-dependent oxidoreductase [Leifsonia sp. NPDC014704]|uniref:NAD(P)H-dependent oxidoreductase n=1 Tax=Leifsonia sp. NPDC014704 TaxID=3364123 RepID=UPI0036F48677